MEQDQSKTESAAAVRSSDGLCRVLCEEIANQTWRNIPITPEMKMEELDLDSLDAIEVIMALEERLSLEIPDEAATADNWPKLSVKEYAELLCANLEKSGVDVAKRILAA